jgi:hypothetical protein
VTHELEYGAYQTSMVIHGNSNRAYNCEPIIEFPPSPVYGGLNDELSDIEDVAEEYYQAKTDRRFGFWKPENGKDMVLTNPQQQTNNLKTIFRLRTEHHAYATIYFLSLQIFLCAPKLDMLYIICRYMLPAEHKVLEQVWFMLLLLKSKLTIIPSKLLLLPQIHKKCRGFFFKFELK